MESLKAVIIEDEYSARKLLAGLVDTYCSGVIVVGQAETMAEGLELINEHAPAIVFLDIQLPGESGLNLIQHFDNLARPFTIIFTTANSDFKTITRYVPNSYFLDKPINIADLIQAVESARVNSPKG